MDPRDIEHIDRAIDEARRDEAFVGRLKQRLVEEADLLTRLGNDDWGSPQSTA